MKIMVIEKKVSLDESEAAFLNSYSSLGFRSEHELLTEALQMLKEKMAQDSALIYSAALYVEVYEQDDETREWTRSAAANWPGHD